MSGHHVLSHKVVSEMTKFESCFVNRKCGMAQSRRINQDIEENSWLRRT